MIPTHTQLLGPAPRSNERSAPGDRGPGAEQQDRTSLVAVGGVAAGAEEGDARGDGGKCFFTGTSSSPSGAPGAWWDPQLLAALDGPAEVPTRPGTSSLLLGSPVRTSGPGGRPPLYETVVAAKEVDHVPLDRRAA